MIIHDLDIDGAGRAIGPFKTDAPLAVNANAVLSLPITGKCFEAIARQRCEIPKGSSDALRQA
jgi:hypothetical protein